jgi:hypothetical protein
LFGRLRRIYSIGKDESDIMCQFPEFIKSTDNVAWKSSRHFYDGSDNLSAWAKLSRLSYHTSLDAYNAKAGEVHTC